MKRVGTADRGRAALGHHVGDPVRGVGGHVVICAHRSAPSALKNRRRVVVSRPGAAHTNRPLSWSTTTVR